MVPITLLILNSRTFPEVSRTLKDIFPDCFCNQTTYKFTEKQHLLRTEHFQKRRLEGCKHCVLAVVNFCLPQTPFPGAQDTQNLISWRWSLPSPTDTVW